MATVKIKVRALTKAALDRDFVILKQNDTYKQYFFEVSPFGTDIGNVIETIIPAAREADFKAAIEAKEGITIQQNPKWDDVKTDTDGDGVADKGQDVDNDGATDTDQDGNNIIANNWVKNSNLYEIVV